MTVVFIRLKIVVCFAFQMAFPALNFTCVSRNFPFNGTSWMPKCSSSRQKDTPVGWYNVIQDSVSKLILDRRFQADCVSENNFPDILLERDHRQIHVDYPRTNYKKYTVIFKGRQIWNNLATAIKSANSIHTFDKKNKKYYLRSLH